MTTPGGGGGFEVGSDYVAASVGFDIDATGISSLRELTQELDRYRTSSEAAARGSESFTKYLQQMTQVANQATEAQTQLIAQLQRMTDVQQLMMTGQGTQINRGVPQGYIDPFSGMGAGTGGQPNRLPAGSTGGYAPTMLGAQSYQNGMSQSNPNFYMTWQAQRGNLRTGDIPAASPGDQDMEQLAQRHARREDEQVRRNTDSGGGSRRTQQDLSEMAQRRAEQFSGGASQLLSELAPGGTPVGMMQLGQRGLASLSGMARGSGAIGAMAGIAGPAAAALGIGAAGMYAVQAGGAVVQDYRAMGNVHGGGLKEGLGYEMAIRSMALNPFITTDQARQIVAQGMSSGHTGKEFDTLTQFMANNLKEMNMSAAESMAIFRKNVYEGGMSKESMASTMGILKSMSGQPGSLLTVDDLQKGYGATSAALINAGASGPAASRSALQSTQMFPDVESLKDVMPQMAQVAAGNTSTAALIRTFGGVNVPGNISPGGAMEYLTNTGQDNKAITNTLAYYAKQFYNSSGPDKSMAVDMFQRFGARSFPGLGIWNNRTAVKELMMKLIQGNTGDLLAKADQRVDSAGEKNAEVTERGNMSVLGSRIAASSTTVGNAIFDFGKNVLGHGFNFDGYDWSGTQEASGKFARQTARLQSPMLTQIMDQNGGAQGIEVGSGGKWSGFDPQNEEQVRALSSGQLKWRRKGEGGSGLGLKDTPSDGSVSRSGGIDTSALDAGGAKGKGGSSQSQKVEVGGVVTIKLDQDGRVKDYTREARLTPNQQQAMAGYGQASMNNPPPGDTPGRNGYS